ncbi:MAG: P-type conjugative transfer ATPase TrbB [Synergistaceae bacterium]|nr:P-type conjugative transfer ATPase TrbB [Synergistaceae bacterium]MBR0074406.1 P-type conjugative transfer ATPase TrbB [Synergistaceae bacterium]MBR0316722.1 P-type conjugative transfer ATPase TrbB [Synergistaceae bacterium]
MTELTKTSEEVIRRNLEKLRREMGEEIRKAMDNPQVIEIMLNPDGSVWTDEIGVGMNFLCSMSAVNALQMLGTVAHMLGTVINYHNPVVEGELPGDGSRVEGVIPPIVPNPSFNIRKKASAIFSLAEYVNSGRVTDKDIQILCEAISTRKNILVVGGTGTGKTTFVNAIINEMKILTPKHRLLILEDTLELQCSMENFVSMRTSSDKSIQDLLKITMRQRPDRIIIGEVRGKEALDMLKAWNTGHPGGVCTVHANDARAGLLRIEQLISEVSQSPMKELIAEAIDVIAFLVRDPHIGPKLSELVAVDGIHDGQYVFHNLKEVVA